MNQDVIGMKKEDLDTPVLMINADILDRNLNKMKNAVSAKLRPHLKTHKCSTLAKKQLELGAIGITCAKVSDAEVLANNSISNILVANQIVGPKKIERLLNIAEKTLVRFLVDNPININELASAATSRQLDLHVLLELEVGMDRCGVLPNETALELAQKIVHSRGLLLDGIEFYEGHVSRIPNFDERKTETKKCLAEVITTRDMLENANIPIEIVSSGATNTYSITGNYPGITEIRPGTYVFMDTTSKPFMPDFDYALTVLGTVVSVPSSDRVVIDAGSTSMSQDKGIPSLLHPPGWKLVWLHEAHGGLERIDGPPLNVGDKVELIPSHACTTSNLYDQFHVIRNGYLEDIWEISNRGKIQ